MPELKKFDYFFLRYAPYPAMDDYVTFGVIMLEAAPHGFAGVRFMKSWRRLLCSHPDADLDYFRFLEQDIREHLASGVRRDQLLARMHDCFGNAVQLSPYRECLAEDAEAGIELLARGSIDLPMQAGKQEPHGRRRILHKIKNAYESAGIWGMVLKNVPVSEYTYSGDPLKIDVSYRPNGVVNMLQAVSLETSVDPAKALAFSYPHLVAGIARREQADTALTAIVDDDLDRHDPEIEFALGTLERSGIALAVSADLPQIAQQARTQLMA
jgi:Protein of unknown function (DUF3037)